MLRQMGIFKKYPMVNIETVNLCLGQLKEEENGQPQVKYQETAPEVLKVGDTCPTPAEHFEVHWQVLSFISYANNDLYQDVCCIYYVS